MLTQVVAVKSNIYSLNSKRAAVLLDIRELKNVNEVMVLIERGANSKVVGVFFSIMILYVTT